MSNIVLLIYLPNFVGEDTSFHKITLLSIAIMIISYNVDLSIYQNYGTYIPHSIDRLHGTDRNTIELCKYLFMKLISLISIIIYHSIFV